MRDTVREFISDKTLYEASEVLLEKLGVQYSPLVRGKSFNDCFQQNDFTFQYVEEVKKSIEEIWFVGYVNNTTFQNSAPSEENAKYFGLSIFACEIKPEAKFSRSSAVALTRAFNRISTRDVNDVFDMPVIVIIRQGAMLSLATCERSDRKDGNGEKVGKVTILRDMNCLQLHAGHRQILERIKENVRGCKSYEELHQKWFDSFNIKIISDKFFKDYKAAYEDIVEHITGKRMKKINSKWVEVDNENPCKKIMSEFSCFADPEKSVRDYVKNLMGRLVFIQFLQKKGWMGVPAGDSWDGGDPEFLQNLFHQSEHKEDFVDKVLEPLFNDLNTRRENDLISSTEVSLGKQIKVPYLNGGLFDVSDADKLHFKIPSKFFWNSDERKAEKHPGILRLFANYNFTIDENAPDNVEVAVDPEMLSRIFENLLEDNKEKGAFYTPKEIVQYMCRESLISYLEANTSIAKDKIRQFVLSPEEGIADIHENKKSKLLAALKEVKICDPAIGSGAFPMGMLYELLHCREVLSCGEYGRSEIKREIIKNNIYGVDIEKGAVDIARLRFWLSLIVDEDSPSPMPNLDYKIMQGNSLVENYEGVDLTELTYRRKSKNDRGYFDLFEDEKNHHQKKVTGLLNLYYSCSDHARKESLHQQIAETINGLLESQAINPLILQKLRNIDIAGNTDFFLWHTWFSDVFNQESGKNGFDIVIGNPPYGVSIMGTYRDLVVKVLGRVPDYEIYYFFFELAKKLVKADGLLSYIVPNTWLFNTFARSYRLGILENWEIEEILDCSKFKIFKDATVMNSINLLRRNTLGNSLCGYKNTLKANDFLSLVSEKRVYISMENLLQMNQNWALAFRLSPAIVKIVNKVANSGKPLSNYFATSQGLIAYDKYQGQSQELIKSRVYHFDSYKEGLKKWLWGEDVKRYALQWNGKEWIDYCDGIANPRKPEFFIGKRLLVREITNPSIFAVITSEELYNDPGVIIVKDSNQYCLEVVLAILNSKLATFYHFNHSPKATKGAFPKIIVQDIKDFPLPSISNEIKDILSKKALSILLNKQMNPLADTTVEEREIDNIVYKIYGLTEDEIKIVEGIK